MIFTTLIPTRFNDGSSVPPATLEDVKRGLWVKFGGVTIEGLVQGHWIDTADGRHYQDESIKVTVACDAERLAEAEAEVRDIGRRLKQIAMYFEVRYFDGVRFLQTDKG
jgi:hypothetical protein